MSVRRLVRAVAMLTSAVVVCGALATPAPAAFVANGNHPDVHPPQSRPYGWTMTQWGQAATQWVYGTPYEQSPLFDPTGANCASGQQGPVWFIARIAGPPIFEGTRRCTIPHGKSILLYIGAVAAAYPCAANPSYRPAPGQSLYDFLAADADTAMDTVDELDVTIDGSQVSNVLEKYRVVSSELFTLVGHESMAGVYDPCITGEPQSAVIDGFFMMLKPLPRGVHSVRVHGTNTFGHDKTFNYILAVS